MEDKQEIVEFVALFMQQQDAGSSNYGYCQNRDSKGRACAIGCLLDESTAKKYDFDDATLERIVHENWSVFNDLSFFSGLRSCHDMAVHDSRKNVWRLRTKSFLHYFSERLEKFCVKQKLEFPGEYL
jgi:hypothetical protein